MEGLWRGWHFAMIGMKKLQDEACVLLSNGNGVFCLPLKFSAGFVIPDAMEYN